MTEQKDLAYDTMTTEAWLDEVEKWPWQKLDRDRWRKTGPCPRCNHTMDIPFDVSTMIFRGHPNEDAEDEIDNEAYGRCNCAAQHPGRPDGESGCGPSGFFSPPKTGKS